MAIVGDLVANLTADSSGFLSGIVAAARGVTGLVSTVTVNSSKVAKEMATTAKTAAQAAAITSRAKGAEAMAYARTAAIARQSLARQANDQKLTAAKIAAMQAKTALAAQKAQAQAMKGAATSGILQASAIIAAVHQMSRMVMGSINAFRESEKAGKKLDSVLASTGGAAGLTGEEIRKLAGDMQSLTNFEDDVTIGAAGVLATFTQISGDTFKSALMAAQDLSAVMGTDLQSSVVQVGKALNDPIRGVTALTRVGVSFSQQQKDQIKQLQESGDLTGAQAVILAELQKEFGGAAQAMADPLTIVSNQIGDIAEGFGALILPSVVVVADSIRSMLSPVAEAGDGFQSWGEWLSGWVAQAIALVRDELALVSAAVQNIGPIFKLLWLEASIAAIQFGGTIDHLLTVEIPAYLTWFGNNWRDVFTTLYNFTSTVFSNLSDNIGRQMLDIWDYVASGGADALDATWTPLTEGFESTVKELPKIAEKIPSALEQGLRVTADLLRTQIGDAFAEAVGVGAADVDKLTRPTFDGLAERAKNMTDETKKAVAMTETRGVSALQRGTGEALSAILGAMRGDSDQKALVKLAQEQRDLQREQLDAMLGLADNDEVVEIAP